MCLLIVGEINFVSLAGVAFKSLNFLKLILCLCLCVCVCVCVCVNAPMHACMHLIITYTPPVPLISKMIISLYRAH